MLTILGSEVVQASTHWLRPFAPSPPRALTTGYVLDVDLLPGWTLQITEGYTVQALTLPLPLAPASARALVKFVASRLRDSPA